MSLKRPKLPLSFSANSRLKWVEPFTTVSEGDFNDTSVRWFTDGKINVADNCVSVSFFANTFGFMKFHSVTSKPVEVSKLR